MASTVSGAVSLSELLRDRFRVVGSSLRVMVVLVGSIRGYEVAVQCPVNFLRGVFFCCVLSVWGVQRYLLLAFCCGGYGGPMSRPCATPRSGVLPALGLLVLSDYRFRILYLARLFTMVGAWGRIRLLTFPCVR